MKLIIIYGVFRSHQLADPQLVFCDDPDDCLSSFVELDTDAQVVEPVHRNADVPPEDINVLVDQLAFDFPPRKHDFLRVHPLLALLDHDGTFVDRVISAVLELPNSNFNSLSLFLFRHDERPHLYKVFFMIYTVVFEHVHVVETIEPWPTISEDGGLV